MYNFLIIIIFFPGIEKKRVQYFKPPKKAINMKLQDVCNIYQSLGIFNRCQIHYTFILKRLWHFMQIETICMKCQSLFSGKKKKKKKNILKFHLLKFVSFFECQGLRSCNIGTCQKVIVCYLNCCTLMSVMVMVPVYVVMTWKPHQGWIQYSKTLVIFFPQIILHLLKSYCKPVLCDHKLESSHYFKLLMRFNIRLNKLYQ